jgi:hypothetical protein
LGYAEFSSELQTPEKPGLPETYRSSGAGTIQNEAPAEMQGLCCFWGVYIFGSVSASVEIAPLLSTRRSNRQTPFSPKARLLPKMPEFPLLCQFMNWQ